MQIAMTRRSVDLNEGDRNYAEKRIGFALGRLATRLRHVSLTVGDTNGPRGGVDKVCRIITSMRRGTPIAVSAQATTVREAVNLAANRARRAVTRRLSRQRTTRAAAGTRPVPRE